MEHQNMLAESGRATLLLESVTSIILDLDLIIIMRVPVGGNTA